MSYKVEYFGAMGLCELYEKRKLFGIFPYWKCIDVAYNWDGPKAIWPTTKGDEG